MSFLNFFTDSAAGDQCGADSFRSEAFVYGGQAPSVWDSDTMSWHVPAVTSIFGDGLTVCALCQAPGSKGDELTVTTNFTFETPTETIDSHILRCMDTSTPDCFVIGQHITGGLADSAKLKMTASKAPVGATVSFPGVPLPATALPPWNLGAAGGPAAWILNASVQWSNDALSSVRAATQLLPTVPTSSTSGSSKLFKNERIPIAVPRPPDGHHFGQCDLLAFVVPAADAPVPPPCFGVTVFREDGQATTVNVSASRWVVMASVHTEVPHNATVVFEAPFSMLLRATASQQFGVQQAFGFACQWVPEKAERNVLYITIAVIVAVGLIAAVLATVRLCLRAARPETTALLHKQQQQRLISERGRNNLHHTRPPTAAPVHQANRGADQARGLNNGSGGMVRTQSASSGVAAHSPLEGSTGLSESSYTPAAPLGQRAAAALMAAHTSTQFGRNAGGPRTSMRPAMGPAFTSDHFALSLSSPLRRRGGGASGNALLGSDDNSLTPHAELLRRARECKEPDTIMVNLRADDRLQSELMIGLGLATEHRAAQAAKFDKFFHFTPRDPYAIISAGGEAVVYSGRCDSNVLQDVHDVAIKLYRSLHIDKLEARTLNELRALNRLPLRQPYLLLPIVAYRHAPDAIAVVMPRGLESLDDRLNDCRDRPFSLTEAFATALHLVDCVAYLHERGLAHGDIKPSNIMYVEGEPLPLLSDFGNVSTSETRRIHTPYGTRRYMPVEFMREGTMRVDAAIRMRADIFMLGVTLLELFIGREFTAAFTLTQLHRIEAAATDHASTSSAANGGDGRMMAAGGDGEINSNNPSGRFGPPTLIETLAACVAVEPSERCTIDALRASLERAEARITFAPPEIIAALSVPDVSGDAPPTAPTDVPDAEWWKAFAEKLSVANYAGGAALAYGAWCCAVHWHLCAGRPPRYLPRLTETAAHLTSNGALPKALTWHVYNCIAMVDARQLTADASARAGVQTTELLVQHPEDNASCAAHTFATMVGGAAKRLVLRAVLEWMADQQENGTVLTGRVGVAVGRLAESMRASLMAAVRRAWVAAAAPRQPDAAAPEVPALELRRLTKTRDIEDEIRSGRRLLVGVRCVPPVGALPPGRPMGVFSVDDIRTNASRFANGHSLAFVGTQAVENVVVKQGEWPRDVLVWMLQDSKMSADDARLQLDATCIAYDPIRRLLPPTDAELQEAEALVEVYTMYRDPPPRPSAADAAPPSAAVAASALLPPPLRGASTVGGGGATTSGRLAVPPSEAAPDAADAAGTPHVFAAKPRGAAINAEDSFEKARERE